jgi:hypothetical protein
MNNTVCKNYPIISSTENGTVPNGDFLAAIKNRLYLCSAFEAQMPEIEY